MGIKPYALLRKLISSRRNLPRMIGWQEKSTLMLYKRIKLRSKGIYINKWKVYLGFLSTLKNLTGDFMGFLF